MKSTGIIDETIKVPQDMILDILVILLKEELKYEITEVLESRALAVLIIEIDQTKQRQIKVLQNIQELLHAYHEFRFSENETLNWREN